MLLLTGSRGFALKKDTVRYDSSVVKLAAPGKLAEQEVFSDPELHYETSAAKSTNWLGRFMEWLGEKLFGHADGSTVSKLWSVFIWGLALTGVGLAIWLLLRSEFTGMVKGTARGSQFNFSDIEEDISGINFSERIRKAFEEGDYRLAIRWHYLKQLFLLNDKALIAWRSNKTNIDYAAELSKTALQKPFNRISYVYEYVWYGKYEIGREKYLEFEKEFNQFEKSMG